MGTTGVLAQIRAQATDRNLRAFAALQLPFFLVVAWLTWRAGWSPMWPVMIAAASAIVLAMGLISPASIRRLYIAWMAAVYPIGWLVSRLALAVVFFGILTPIAWLRRRRGDLLDQQFDPAATSYWQPRRSRRPPDDYFRQF